MTDKETKKPVETPVSVAPQDVEKPEPDAFELVSMWTDEHAQSVLRYGHMRPDPNTLGDVALDLHTEYSEKHMKQLISIVLRGMRAGCSLYLPAKFSVKPEIKAERKQTKGFKQYKKE